MSRLFLFGTLRWSALLEAVAGGAVACVPARLDGARVVRAAEGDWPILVSGDGVAEGLLTEPLAAEARARLDWYEAAFGYGTEGVSVTADEGAVAAEVYRGAGAASEEPWDLARWVDAHGARTLTAAEEVMRGRGRLTREQLQRRRGVIQARAHCVAMARGMARPVTVGGPPEGAVEVRKVDYVYDGFQRVEEWSLTHPQFDGGRSDPIERVVTHVTNAATVLPYDPARDRVLLIEQIRLGALAKGDPNPWMLEPVAGLIDAGETPEATALRELREEAGVEAGPEALRHVGTYYPSPGGVAQIIFSYVALCDLPDDRPGLHGVDDEDEDIRSHVVPLDAMLGMLATGEAANAPLIVSAQWLALNRERLKG
jgi:nudix-type nucleoside diphosphatase (YffH/AdpP family)